MALAPTYMKTATCHLDRKYYAKGLCQPCYDALKPKRKQKPEVARRKNIKRNFKMSVDEYDALLLSTEVCGACRKPFTEDNGPVLDHDHTTDVKRGFVHRYCNMALGIFGDSPAICRLAAEYLEAHSNAV